MLITLFEIGGEKDDSPDAIGTTGWFLEEKRKLKPCFLKQAKVI